MTCYCTKCGINWAELHSVDDEVNDETYQFCPVCRTDSFLVDAVDGPKYLQTITGQLIDVATGKPMEKEYETVEPQKRRTYMDFLADEQEWQDRQTRAIAAYHAAFETQGKQAAEQAYFEKLKN